MVKEGDTLLAKRTRSRWGTKNSSSSKEGHKYSLYKYTIKGQFYKVKDVIDDGDACVVSIYIDDKYASGVLNFVNFRLSYNYEKDEIAYNLFDYFYTEKELRKLKLDKINDL